MSVGVSPDPVALTSHSCPAPVRGRVRGSMRRLRGDFDPSSEDGRSERNHQMVIVSDTSGAPRQLLMVSRDAPPGGLLNSGAGRRAFNSGLLGTAGIGGGRRHLGGLLSAGAGGGGGGGGENDPWATFWASMLASIIVSTDEELAQSLITMFGSDSPPEPPPPATLTNEQFEELEKVEFATSADAVLATPLGKDGRPRVAEPDSCPICMCDYVDGQSLTRLPCSSNHVFHDRCLRTWLLEKSTNCPMCRCDCRPKPAAEPEQVEDTVESLSADIDTAFNAVVEAADRVRDASAEPVPVRTNHNPNGRGLLQSASSESTGEAAARPSTVNRLRRQVTVGRYAERYLNDDETATETDVPASPASAAPSSPASVPSSPAQTAGDSVELPADIVAIEDRMSAARARRAEGAAREASARRAAAELQAAQTALRARREAARELAETVGDGSADRSDRSGTGREMSDWYRNHRTSQMSSASAVAALGGAESAAAARWSATSVPTPAVVHAESQTATLPTLSSAGISAVTGTAQTQEEEEESPLPVPPTIVPSRRLGPLLDSRAGLNASNASGGTAAEPANLSGAASTMASTATATATNSAQPTLTQRWLARGRTIGGRSETATAQIESAVSQLANAREEAAVARRSSAASSRRSAAALNESMRAAAASEVPTSRAARSSIGPRSSGRAASVGTARTGGARGAGRMRRLMREARDLESGGASRRAGGGVAGGGGSDTAGS